MATPAQIAANQANAQHSTGPRTDAGKSKTRTNAIRHGLCSALPDTDPGDQASTLLADLMAEYEPQGPTEQILVYKMAEQFVLTRRAGALLATYTDPDISAKQIALLLRYYNTADRAFNRNLHDLRKIQKEHRQEQQAEPEIGSVSQTDAPPPPEPKTPVPAEPVQPVSVIPDINKDVNQPAFNRSEPQKQAA